MILVTCGTQQQQFTRLFEYVEQLNIDDEVIMQLGHTQFNTRHQSYDFSTSFEEDIKRADIIITHGGVGTIMNGLLNNKKVIVVPRLSKYNEHVDDHQLEITNKLTNLGYIYSANSFEELKKLMDNIDQLSFKPYISTNKEFNQKLNSLLVEL